MEHGLLSVSIMIVSNVVYGKLSAHTADHDSEASMLTWHNSFTFSLTQNPRTVLTHFMWPKAMAWQNCSKLWQGAVSCRATQALTAISGNDSANNRFRCCLISCRTVTVQSGEIIGFRKQPKFSDTVYEQYNAVPFPSARRGLERLHVVGRRGVAQHLLPHREIGAEMCTISCPLRSAV